MKLKVFAKPLLSPLSLRPAQDSSVVLELEHLCCLAGHEKCHPVPPLGSPTLGSLTLESSPTAGCPLALGSRALGFLTLDSPTCSVLGMMCLLSSGWWWGKGQRLPSPEEPPGWRAEMGVAPCGPCQPLLPLQGPLAPPTPAAAPEPEVKCPVIPLLPPFLCCNTRRGNLVTRHSKNSFVFSEIVCEPWKH